MYRILQLPPNPPRFDPEDSVAAKLIPFVTGHGQVTPLLAAVYDGHRDVYDLLVKRKAEVEMRTSVGLHCYR